MLGIESIETESVGHSVHDFFSAILKWQYYDNYFKVLKCVSPTIIFKLILFFLIRSGQIF